MADPVEAARIEAEARARVIWPAGSPDQIAQAEEALRVYFLAKGLTPFEVWTAANRVQSDLDFEADLALPAPANDVVARPFVPTADDLKAELWWEVRDVAWGAIGRPVQTLDGGPPWGFDVQVAFDHRAYLVATGRDYVQEIRDCIDEPAGGTKPDL